MPRPTLLTTASLAFLLLAGCSGGDAAAPELPLSVSPGWSRKTLVRDGPDCWRAEYSSEGSAVVRVCRFQTEAGAFDAVQRTAAAAEAVKFQEGRDFVLVKWSGVSRAGITALVRAIQKALQPH